jgi:hypothetical protein
MPRELNTKAIDLISNNLDKINWTKMKLDENKIDVTTITPEFEAMTIREKRFADYLETINESRIYKIIW